MGTYRTANRLSPRRQPPGAPVGKRSIRTAEVVAAELEGRPVELTDDTATWLTLTMPLAVIEREAIAGVAAATAALSREICALCGGQGDPGPAHRQLAEHALQGLPNGRPAGSAWTPAGPGAAWRRRDPEDAIGDEDLLALMNAGGESDEGAERWPQTFVGGGSTGLAQGGIGGAGWNHLICAACGELVPTPGEAAATVSQIKEKLGALTIYTDEPTACSESTWCRSSPGQRGTVGAAALVAAGKVALEASRAQSGGPLTDGRLRAA